MSTNYAVTAFSDDSSTDYSTSDITTETGRAALHSHIDAAIDAGASSIAVVHQPLSLETAVNALGGDLWNAAKVAARAVAPLESAVTLDVTRFFPIVVPAQMSNLSTGFPNIASATLIITMADVIEPPG